MSNYADVIKWKKHVRHSFMDYFFYTCTLFTIHKIARQINLVRLYINGVYRLYWRKLRAKSTLIVFWPLYSYIRDMFWTNSYVKSFSSGCCHALDVEAMTPYFWDFGEREKLMERNTLDQGNIGLKGQSVHTKLKNNVYSSLWMSRVSSLYNIGTIMNC